MPLKPKKLRINRGRNTWTIFGLVLAITSFNASLTLNYGKGYMAIVYQRKEEATRQCRRANMVIRPKIETEIPLHLKHNLFEG